MAGEAEEENGNEQCCTVALPRFETEYVPAGSMIEVLVEGKEEEELGREMSVYVTGLESQSRGEIGNGREGEKKALVCIYDIFGIHPNTLQGADILAQRLNVPIYVPDLFRGRGWKTDNIPPKEGRPAMQTYIQSIGSWESVGPDLISLVNHLKSEGVGSIGTYGFCFGGKKLAQAASDPRTSSLFSAVALVHPTNLSPTDGELFHVPVALIPSGGEDKDVMNAVWEGLLKNESIAERCVRKDFLDCHHGFASARSDRKDPHMAERVREAYEVLAGFFEKNL